MILDKTKKIKRILFGKGYEDVMEIPNLVDIQLSSYERFLQRKTLLKGEPPIVPPVRRKVRSRGVRPSAETPSP